MKTYILDTNIILDSPDNLIRLSDNGNNTIVIPEIVIDELDNKKSGFEDINFNARQFARMLEDSVITDKSHYGELTAITTTIESLGVTLTIISKHTYICETTTVAANILNDRKILELAVDYNHVFPGAILLSLDIMCRTRALSLGLATEPLTGKAVDLAYNFHKQLELPNASTINGKPILALDPSYEPDNFSYTIRDSDTGQEFLAYVANQHLYFIDDADLGRQTVKPLNKEQKFFVNSMISGYSDIIVIDAKAGSGKAQPLSEQVLTPTGWTTMGSLTAGSQVIGSDGQPKTVLATFPQGQRDIYKVSFIDGTSVLCDLDHLWTVYNNNRKLKTLSTRDMLATWITKESYDKRYDTYQHRYNYAIPKSAPCHFGTDPHFLIDPYALGLLLGDGGFTQRSVSFTNNSLELVNRLESLLAPQYTITKTFKQGAWQCYIVMGTATIPFIDVLAQLGLAGLSSKEKFIPTQYLTATLQSRKALWQGLTDTDGYVKNGKVLEYATSSEQLSQDYLELARSIGKVFTVSSRVPKYTHKGERVEGALSYRLREMADKPKSIINIELSHVEEAQCILIDSPDHLYVTSGYNLTHNTLLALSTAMRLVNKKKYGSITYVRNSIESTAKGEDIGYLPGLEEKFKIYNHPLYDSLRFIARAELTKSNANKTKAQSTPITEELITAKVEELTSKHNIQTMWVGEMRGRTISNSIVIIDEIQNCSASTGQLVLSRLDKDCMAICIGSNRQIDNMYTNKYINALSCLLKATKTEHPIRLFAGELNKVLRGPITEFAEEIFK